MVTEIKVIMFDIGGVVVRSPITQYYTYLSRIGKHSREEVKKELDKLTPPFETGKITLPEFEHALSTALDVHISKINWIGFHKKHITVNIDVADLVTQLHQEYMTAYLTNVDRPKYEVTEQLLKPLPFDHRFASCYMGTRKPEKEIYLRALAAMKVRPAQTIFIDNQIENVEGAARLGINAIHFINRKELDIHLGKLL